MITTKQAVETAVKMSTLFPWLRGSINQARDLCACVEDYGQICTTERHITVPVWYRWFTSGAEGVKVVRINREGGNVTEVTVKWSKSGSLLSC